MVYLSGTTNCDSIADAVSLVVRYKNACEVYLRSDGTAYIVHLQDKPVQHGQAEYTGGSGSVLVLIKPRSKDV